LNRPADGGFLVRWVLVVLGLQGLVWFSGLGDSDAHLVLVPFWLLPALWLVLRSRHSPGLRAHAEIALARLDRLPPVPVFSAMLGLFGTAWAVALACKYLSFGFAGYDAGIYTSIAYNSAHGHLFYSSVQQMNHLGEHFSPVMVLFAPLLRIWPHPFWLLAALLAAYLAVPLLCYYICRDLVGGTRPRATAYIISLLWLVYTPMTSAVSYAFHPSTLAAPLILLAYYLVERKRWVAFLVVILVLPFFKENLALVWVGFGLYLSCTPRTRLRGVVLAVAGVIVLWLLVGQVIPAFRGASWSGHLGRFGPLSDPLPKLQYLLWLLAPLGFLPLMRWRTALLVLPAIALNLASRYAPQYGMTHHYDDVVAPMLFAGTLAVLGDILRDGHLPWRIPRGIQPFLILVALVMTMVQLGEAPCRLARRSWPDATSRAVQAELRTLLAELPETQMLFVQSHLDLHVQRYAKADLSLCDLDAPPPGALLVLSRHVNPWPMTSLDELEQALRSRRPVFKRLRGHDHLIVYQVRSRPPTGGASAREKKADPTFD
jgi:uncharacterized membrane protein